MLAPHQRERTTGKLLLEATEEIGRLHAAIVMTLEENKHLADGDNCTLIRLKRAVCCLDQAHPTAAGGEGGAQLH
jgi:hypothetical protein